jgi:hypothetical protein
MSVEMIDRVYGHHHPDHLRKAALALGYRRRQSLAVAKAFTPTVQEVIEIIGGPTWTRTRNQTVMSEDDDSQLFVKSNDFDVD